MKYLLSKRAKIGLLVLLAALCLCTAAYASSGTCGENLTWTLNDSNLALTISGTGKMDDFDWGSTLPWGTSVCSVLIEEGVTGIGNFAFFDCVDLVRVSIPDTVGSIGEWAFYNCSALTKIALPDSMTVIGDHAFNRCQQLSGIRIPKSLTSIGCEAFSNCYSLPGVTIPAGLTSIGDYAFYYCPNLKEINVDPQNAVYSSVDGILFNKAKTRLITYPTGKEGTSYTVPGTVTCLGEYAFDLCANLTAIKIPDSVTTIESHAFSWLTGLTDITIPKSVNSIGLYPFQKCISLKDIGVDSGNAAYTSVNGILFSKDKSSLLAYPAGKTDSSYSIPDSVTSLSYGVFSFCSALESVTFPDSVTAIPGDLFSYCDGLTSVTIPVSVTSIGTSAFWNTENLRDVYYGGTEEDRSKIKIEESNEYLTGAVWHYAEAEPEPISIKGAEFSAIRNQVYTGKAIRPKFTVRLNGQLLSKGTDYKVTYKNNKAVGTATVIVTGKGSYTGTAKATFRINPKPVPLTSLKAGSKKLTVKWKKGSVITGYEVQYSQKKNFAKAKTIRIGNAKATGTVIKKLVKGKTYYVRIRTYKTVKGKKYYSTWSKALKAKVK